MLVFLTYFHTKIDSRWIKDFKIIYETVKIIGENMDNYFYNHGLKKASLNIYKKPGIITSKDCTSENIKIL